ncbi:hypothetical protein NX774_20095 [Massilia agilis]|uniref:NHL repeat-containing protein n=1 Tax=Massilia agilis TaxID=1811226 RepID=A0ABT2DFX7_9BURK|nr:hypothetical protein [Massilia agilis]MCS0810230.1 hypothetical protein [Massilia agilis]
MYSTSIERSGLARRRAFVLTALALLAGCGGGGDSKPAPVVEPEHRLAITVVAGDPIQSGSADGTGGGARFAGPSGIAIGDGGNLYVADTHNNTIRRITPAGQVSTLAGSATAYGSDDGIGAAARFAQPAGLAIDAGGNLFVADYLHVRKVSPAGAVTTIATIPLGTNNDGRSMQQFVAQAVAVAPNGDVYATTGIGTRRITATGTTIIEGVDTMSGVFGTRFPPARGITVDSSGTVYVADLQQAVSKVAADGKLVLVAGTPGQTGDADGTGTAASFNGVTSLATDSAGNLYAADRFNNLIRKITPAGVVTTYAGTRGSATVVPGPLPGSVGPVTSVAVDRKTGAIYATSGNAVIRIAMQ